MPTTNSSTQIDNTQVLTQQTTENVVSAQSEEPQTTEVEQQTTEVDSLSVKEQLARVQEELSKVKEQLTDLKLQDQLKQAQEELKQVKEQLSIKTTQVQAQAPTAPAPTSPAPIAPAPTSFNTGLKSQSQARNLDPSPDEIIKISERLDSKK